MKHLEFTAQDGSFSAYSQIAILYDTIGGVELARLAGSTAPNPLIPKQPDRPNMSEYPIVAPGIYLSVFDSDRHHGRPCLALNDDGPVWILQDMNPRYPNQGNMATHIRVHEGYSASWRGSAGCMTLRSPGGDIFLLENFVDGEKVSVYIPNQDWFSRR